MIESINPAGVLFFFLAFHFLGDFVLQGQWLADNKLLRFEKRPDFYSFGPYSEVWVITNFWKSFLARSVHVFLYTWLFWVLGYCTLGLMGSLYLALAIYIPHWVIDIKRWASGDKWPSKPLAVDQSLHLTHLAIVFAFFYGQNP